MLRQNIMYKLKQTWQIYLTILSHGRANEMAPWVEVLATCLDHLNLIPGTHKMEGENECNIVISWGASGPGSLRVVLRCLKNR